MTVEELIEELRLLPATAIVVARVRLNRNYEGGLEPLYEWRSAPVDAAFYDLGEVWIQLDE